MRRPLLLILLAALAACKSATRPLPVPPPAPAPAAETMAAPSGASDTVTARIDNGWIDVTVTIPRAPTGPRPIVISPIIADDELLEHGIAVAHFHTNWEALRGFAAPARDAASAGGAPSAAAQATPAAPAAPAQPETQVGTWLLASPRPGIIGRAYFEIISMDATHSLPKVVDYLSTLPQIDPRRIGLTGSSTSGFAALQGMAAEPRIAVAVVRVACGDYMRFLRSSSLALNDDPRWLPGGKMVLDPDYAVEIAALEPIRHADRYPPRPLLLLAGEQDRAIPFACVESTVQHFRAAYEARGAGDRFRFLAFPASGHNLEASANAEILPWLERWLESASAS